MKLEEFESNLIHFFPFKFDSSTSSVKVVARNVYFDHDQGATNESFIALIKETTGLQIDDVKIDGPNTSNNNNNNVEISESTEVVGNSPSISPDTGSVHFSLPAHHYGRLVDTPILLKDRQIVFEKVSGGLSTLVLQGLPPGIDFKTVQSVFEGSIDVVLDNPSCFKRISDTVVEIELPYEQYEVSLSEGSVKVKGTMVKIMEKQTNLLLIAMNDPLLEPQSLSNIFMESHSVGVDPGDIRLSDDKKVAMAQFDKVTQAEFDSLLKSIKDDQHILRIKRKSALCIHNRPNEHIIRYTLSRNEFNSHELHMVLAQTIQRTMSVNNNNNNNNNEYSTHILQVYQFPEGMSGFITLSSRELKDSLLNIKQLELDRLQEQMHQPQPQPQPQSMPRTPQMAPPTNQSFSQPGTPMRMHSNDIAWHPENEEMIFYGRGGNLHDTSLSSSGYSAPSQVNVPISMSTSSTSVSTTTGSPVLSTSSTGITNNNNNCKEPQPQPRTKFVVASNAPKWLKHDELAATLRKANYKVLFITIRSKFAYVELDKESHAKLLAQKTLTIQQGKIVEFTDYTKEIPYYYVYLYPDPSRHHNWVVLNLLRKVSPMIGVLQGAPHDHLQVPVPTDDERKLLLDRKLMTAKDKTFVEDKSKNHRGKIISSFWLFDAAQPRKMEHRVTHISDTTNMYLEKVNVLHFIIKEHSVMAVLVKDGASTSVKLSSPLKSLEPANTYLNNKIKEVKETTLHLSFESLLIRGMVHHFLTASLKSKPNIVYSIKESSNKDKHMIQPVLCGPDSEVKEVLAALHDIEHRVRPLPQVSLIPDAVENEFSIKAAIEGSNIIFCGPKAKVKNFENHLESSGDKRMEIPMSKGVQFFFKKFVKQDIEHRIKITESKNGLFLVGDDKDLQEAKRMLDHLTKSVEMISFTKTFSEVVKMELTNWYQAYFKDEPIFCHFMRSKSNPTKRQTKSSWSGSEDEESSVDESELDSSSDDEFIPAFDEKLVILDLEFYIHRERSYQALKDKVEKLERQKEGRAVEIKDLSQDEIRYIMTSFEKQRARLFKTKNSIYVQGLWEQDVKKLLSDIQIKRESFVTMDQTATLQEWQHMYLAVEARKDEMQTRFGVKLSSDNLKPCFIIKGKPKDVMTAKKHINELIKDLKGQEFELPLRMAKNLDETIELRRKLTEAFEVMMYHVPNQSRINVIGSSKLNWNDVANFINKLKHVEALWPPEDKPALKEDFKPHSSFVVDMNLLSFKHDSNSSRFRLTAKTQEDIDGAIKALDELVKDAEMTSIKIELKPEFISILVKYDPDGELKELFGKHQDVKFEKYESALYVQLMGKKKAVDAAHKDTVAWVKAKTSALATRQHPLPRVIANEVLKSGFVKSFFGANKVLLQPDVRTNKTMLSVTYGGVTIEVNKGDILLEHSEAIVNAANNELQHHGGIARHIADAAGLDFEVKCRDLVHSKGKVKTGSAMSTPSGKLYFKAIIHAVAPIWSSSNQAHCKLLLRSAVIASLWEAVDIGCTSVSLPAIGSGIFGIPYEVCATITIQAIYDFIDKNNKTPLKSIKVCDNNDDKVLLFSNELQSKSSPLGRSLFTGPQSTATTLLRELANNNFDDSNEPFKVAYQWKWQENDGSYVKFDVDQNYQIEYAYLKGDKKLEVQGDLEMQKNGQRYEIDLVNKTELNTHFKKNARSIIRERMLLESAAGAKQSTWYYRDERSGRTVSIPDPTNQIDLAQQRQQHLKIGNYKVMFPTSTVEVYTGVLRTGTYPLINSYQEQFDRHLESVNKPKHSDISADDLEQDQPEEESQKVNIRITALTQERLQTAIITLEKTIKDTLYEDRLVQITVEEYKKRDLKTVLDKVAKQHGCEIKATKDAIRLIGPKESASAAEIKMMRLLLISSKDTISYPWEKYLQQEQTANCVITQLDPQSAEYQAILQRVHQSIPTIVMVKIERIQNKHLWERYATRKQQILKKMNVNVNNSNNSSTDLASTEMMLFHGTRANSPTLIYNDEDGFDTRFSNQGMWGVATYFADKASYSLTYSSVLPSRHRQMFYARTMLGDCTHIMPNRAFTKPPQKPDNQKGYTEYYDSISGETGGSKVYMVYENNRAYPEYLLTYN
ncbi:hypothetical protein SAMD00019534_023390 [Acytostelium subglobosum LB1]|uniref:hypothetical protein n=1 Tax=Acytostelium subglobosum LB1 TaxID=1410327 RepID=UPI000644D524|nr:hypothetical protein SAMD00019534_023390 [Acytostelium subglobosum LB1]GAM19164.1 hypothetical protein SAMD00019534_023390 [Acytostelium subglobosum LB1]|eukprot:XP_012757091.1 hypothetical protein SAMD00019534_023390 [Acytostelium subglobosum LB1]